MCLRDVAESFSPLKIVEGFLRPRLDFFCPEIDDPFDGPDAAPTPDKLAWSVPRDAPAPLSSFLSRFIPDKVASEKTKRRKLRAERIAHLFSPQLLRLTLTRPFLLLSVSEWRKKFNISVMAVIRVCRFGVVTDFSFDPLTVILL